MEPGNCFAELTKVAYLLVEFCQPIIKQGFDMSTGRLSVVAEMENFADLSQGQSGALAPADEAEPGNHILRVVTVAAGHAGWRWNEAGGLVEPQCFRSRTRGRSQFADPHKYFPC